MTSTKMKKYKIAALIVAAGMGNRCNTTIPKQYIKLAGKSVLFHTIKKFLANQYIDYIRVVIHKDHEDFYREEISSITDTKLLSPIHGGKSRQDSVKQGLESLRTIDPEFVIIHDACRPFVSLSLIDKLVESINLSISCDSEYIRPLAELICDEKYLGEVQTSTAEYFDVFEECRQALTTKLPSEIKLCKGPIGIVPAIEVIDTVSLVTDSFIDSVIPREKLRAIQTPQIFNFKELLSFHESSKEFTDDSSLVVEHKKRVAIIQGEKSNFKLTREEDINMAKLLLEEPKFRVGTGYDIHRFIKTQDEAKYFIKICGVEIEHDMAIEAHSDGDVAIHAIVDAILGALGCGDIGEHFPPDLLKWKDCDSSMFFDFAAKKAKEKGYRVSNLDVTIVCEKPKISPYKTEMKKTLSKILGIDDEFINIKATTAEKLGSIGREEGIAAHAVVLLCKTYNF